MPNDLKDTVENVVYEIDDLIIEHMAESSPFKGTCIRKSQDRLTSAILSLLEQAIQNAVEQAKKE
jgi:hypothetical protein